MKGIDHDQRYRQPPTKDGNFSKLNVQPLPRPDSWNGHLMNTRKIALTSLVSR